jgi:aspartyl protease family protein
LDSALRMSAIKYLFMLGGCGSLLCVSCCTAPAIQDSSALPPISANAAIVGSPVYTPASTIEHTGRATYTRADDGLFYVPAMVNGKQVRFLLDTGANMVVLTPEDARRLGVEVGIDGASESIETAAGRSGMDRVMLDQVHVAGQDVKRVEAAVVRNGLQVSLLGQNLLSRLGPITMTRDRVQVR